MAVYSGGIPENIIEDIIARNDIASVVGQYVRFTKNSGQNQFGLCPFHSEDTPSFSISVSKQIYYCFGCHKGGNVIHFIMEIEKLNYIEALKLLAERAQVALPEPQDDSYRKTSMLRDSIREALLEAARYYYKSLHSEIGKPVTDYLARRKITTSTAKAFGLGYAPDEWGGLYRHLRSKGFSEEVLSGCGLFTKTKKNELIDLFRGRLMFPIFDPQGKILAFGGRILSDGMPKYINSPETPVYSKQKNLYGLNFAKTSKEKTLIIVEGYMDVISMHQAGVKNAVASLGTALTERQLSLASRYAEEIVLFYDSDNAGQNAAIRGLKLLMAKTRRQTGMNVKISVGMVPDGKDPDEYIRQFGADAFRKVVSEALPVMDYLIFSARRQSVDNGKFDARTFQMLSCMYLSWEPNIVLRERAASQVAQILGVSVASVLAEAERASEETKEIETFVPRSVPEKQTVVRSPVSDGSSATHQEIVLLCLLSGKPGILGKMPDKPIPTDFSPGVMREIASTFIASESEPASDVIRLLDIAGDKELNGRLARDVFTEILMKTQDIRDEDSLIKMISDYLYRVREQVYTNRKKYLAEQMDGMPEGTDRDAAVKAFREVTEYLKFLRDKIKELSQ